MSNLSTDPFGLKLIKRNKPKKEEPVPEEPTADSQAYYYYYPCNAFPAYHPYYPAAAPAMAMVPQQFVFYQPQYYTHVIPQQEVNASHQCVSCTSDNKCKACKKEERARRT